MSLGIIMLIHANFDRAEQLARHWSDAGCPVVIHVDLSVKTHTLNAFRESLADVSNVRFSHRHRCEWGTWGLVAAAQDAAELMLEQFPDVGHVYLASGSCLPLRPVKELIDYLGARADTDFIESATTADVPWTVGGLDKERFTLRFPFSWRKRRTLFDRYVALQRRLGIKRRIPDGITPHLGSQWWCLTRETLSAILSSPDRARYDRYFSKVWIPDESYFQTLARKYSPNIESRSLTLSKFDYQGRPYIFYDDHLQVLRRSDCFVGRKIWPRADGLYDAFLTDATDSTRRGEPNPARIERIFAKAVERRTRGRPGLYMQSRFPAETRGNELTAAKYSVFQGFSDLFEDFETWLARVTGAQVHGHLFAPERAEFSQGANVMSGALSHSAALRDYNPRAFLTNLIWNTRGQRQCFQFGPRDNQEISEDLVKDRNAQISVISGAWAVPLFRSTSNFDVIRREAARLQQIETKHLELLRANWVKARVDIWTMAEFMETPMEFLQTIINDIRPQPNVTEVPKLIDLTGFDQFLQKLKNQGMHPLLMGDFPVNSDGSEAPSNVRKTYMVR